MLSRLRVLALQLYDAPAKNSEQPQSQLERLSKKTGKGGRGRRRGGGGVEKDMQYVKALTLNGTTLQNNLTKSVKYTFKQGKHATATKRAREA